MTLEQTIAFLTFSVVGAITPGPSNVMIMATGSLVGLTRGLPCVLGAALGMSSLFFCAGLGLAQLFLLYPLTLAIMNLIGAAFLFWLAWKIATADVTEAKGDTKAVGFLQAAAFQWMNPKGWLVAVSGIAAYSGASPGSAFGLAATFAVLFFVAAFPSGLAWLMAGALMQKLLQDARIARAFNIVMAIVLAGSVATIFVWPETAAFIP
ncbi:LysE family translocator [Rhizobium mongolense]|uniref:LysE family translocator n=1 Tax=Rhizobium mongolense TaxID=57676 RepID=UPI0034A4B0C0